MSKKIFIITIVALAAIGGGAFYGGMKYGENKNSRGAFFQGGSQDFRNLSAEERQKMSEQFGTNGGARAANFRGGANMVAGEIISKDDKSITVKLPDGGPASPSQGGSKIVFFSDSTSITKSVDGSVSDLKEGEQVTITGEQNSDGSYTAKMIRFGSLANPQ